jgi:hypothetical protein
MILTQSRTTSSGPIRNDKMIALCAHHNFLTIALIKIPINTIILISIIVGFLSLCRS